MSETAWTLEPGPTPVLGASHTLSRTLDVVQRVLDHTLEGLRVKTAAEVGTLGLRVPAPARVAAPVPATTILPWISDALRGTGTVFERLEKAFGLDDLSLSIAVMALAPTFSHRVAQGYALLRHDPDSPVLSAGVILDLLGLDGAPGLESVFDALAPGTPLVDLELVHVPAVGISSMRDNILPSARLLELARGHAGVGGDLPPGTRLEPSRRIESLVLPTAQRIRVETLIDELRDAHERRDLSAAPTVVLTGPTGVGKGLVALHLAKAVSRPLLRVNLGLALGRGSSDGARIDPGVALRPVRRAAREALIQGALLYLEGLEGLDASLDLELGQFLQRHLDGYVLGSTGSLAGRRVVSAVARVAHVALTRPTPAERRTLWARHLPRALAPTSECLDIASHRYRVTGGQIRLASVVMADACAGRGAQSVTIDIIDEAIRATVTHTLESVARRLPRLESIADLVTSKETELLLRVMSANYRHRHKVFEDWGFARRFSRGLGLSALFSGPPGTGKTMAAGVVASELGLPLYQIELSQVVSKWVGETEKHLDQVFAEAAAASAVILFDEADSLFARRTEVSSANDRYANLEVNHLLQHIEAFEGICILTTNSLSAIDPAFMRRFAYQLTFPLPDAQERALLWERLIPPEAAVERPIRFDMLAKTFEFSGGHIKNAILRAAFFAVERGTSITESLLLLTGGLEQKQLGVAVRQVGVASLWDEMQKETRGS